MAKKIATVDAEAMNSLYASELKLAGVKTAADDKGEPKDPQAFKDHSEYLAVLEAVMKEDAKVDGSQNPNDPLSD
jgi:hypothetical protein